MLIVVGLGNPGPEYTGTRHNIGFMTLDDLGRELPGASGFRMEKSFRSEVSEGRIGAEKIMLVRPLTFMNLSGDAVLSVVSYFKADPEEDLVVVCDDIHLDPGRIRIRKKGSDGGHNGLKDIILKLGTGDFTRIRVGVGNVPQHFSQVDWVLSRFDADERPLIDEACHNAAKAVLTIASEGSDQAMNLFNVRKTAQEDPGD